MRDRETHVFVMRSPKKNHRILIELPKLLKSLTSLAYESRHTLPGFTSNVNSIVVQLYGFFLSHKSDVFSGITSAVGWSAKRDPKRPT